MSLLSRIFNVFRQDYLTRDIDEELAAHIEEAVESGRDPAEVRRSFGSLLRQRESSRDVRILGWFDSLRADIVFGWRQLKKHKVISAAAILSLGLSIGACTTAFRIIDALFLRPLPIAHPERLYALSWQGTDINGKPRSGDGCSYPMFRQMQAAVGDRADLLAISYAIRWDLTYGSDQDVERAYGQYVSGRLFSAFGLHPALGRLLSQEDDAPGQAYAVLSFDYWTRRFGRDPKVIGRTLHFRRDLYTIVGVAPQEFTGIEPGILNDIFVPAMMHPGIDTLSNWFRTVFVLKSVVPPERVGAPLQAAVDSFWEAQVKTVPNMPQKVRDRVVHQKVVLEAVRSGISGMQSDYRKPLIALSVLVALVLLIACANVANLMTAQAAARAREMALRVSIGAGRGRLIQLVLVESAILAAFAAAVGGLFAIWSAPFVVARINPPDNAARLVLPADCRVLGFVFALTLAVVLLYGLAPALRAAQTNPVDALKGRARKSSVSRHALIAAQVALCFLVLFVAGLFVATLDRLSHQPLGFSPDRILALDISAQDARTPAVWSRVLETLQSAPGVEQGAAAEFPLLSGPVWNNFVAVNGHPPGSDVSDFLSVSPGWFETMKIPFLAGRDFRPDETFPGQTAIVNQAFTDSFFKGEDALGKSFEVRVGADSRAQAKLTIVGVVANAQYANLKEPIPPVAYVPSRSTASPEITVLVRTASANPIALVATLRQAIFSAEPGLRLSGVHTQRELIDNQTIRERLLAMLASFFATVALLLAGIGLYGVLDYSVLQRRREIGIRVAVGARTPAIVRTVSLGILGWVLTGAAGGLALGLVSARYTESLLYGVKATDPSALATPALVLMGAAIVAVLPPVLRAARVDPVEVLRCD